MTPEQRAQLIEAGAQAIANQLGSKVRGIDRRNAEYVVDGLGIELESESYGRDYRFSISALEST